MASDRLDRSLQRVFLCLTSLVLVLVSFSQATVPAASSSAFSFNWTAAPSSPQPWSPRPVNDWDVIANIDGPTDLNGSMEAGHGPDCGAPPATHHVASLGDSVFLCKSHMMTAIFGGGDAFVGYGAVFFTPAQLVDWSQGPATITWKVSTQRTSTRDWWTVNLTPFAQNLVLPLVDLPAYQGEPQTGLEVQMDNGTCQRQGLGTIFRVSSISNRKHNELTQHYPCVEDSVAASAQTRSEFQLAVSADHLKFFMPSTNTVWYDGPIQLPFSQAILQFSHHSYNPHKGEGVDGGESGPNTFHWSDVSISAATPFTMLRPQQPASLHEGVNPALKLPQPSPQDAFLRFAGLGNFHVSFDGGHTFQAARVQGSDQYFDHFASYWTPVPAGTTEMIIRGEPNSSKLSWWVEDISVWSQTAPAPVPGAPVPALGSAPASGNSSPSGSGPGTKNAHIPPRTGGEIGYLQTKLAHGATSIRSIPEAFWAGALAGALAALMIACAAAVAWRRRRRRREVSESQ